jgi:hypothetical protein
MQGMLSGFPPGLQGYLAADQMRGQKQAQQLGMLGQLANLQSAQAQQQMIPLQMQKIQGDLLAAQRQQGAIDQFAQTLPDGDRAKFLANPAEYIKEANKKYTVGRNLVTGAGQPVFTAPQDQTLTEVGVPGQPGVTQRAWVLPGQTDVTPVGAPKMPEILNPEVQAAKQKVAASGASRTNVTVNPMRETFKDEQALRGEYTDASKSFIKLAEGYSKVKGALASDATKSAPATLAAATQFMKMLDPESVVRESELGMALSAAGVWDRFTNLYNTVQNGKVLTPQQSKEFGRIADVVYDAANKAQQARVQHFQGLAKSYNFDPSRVVPDLTPKATNAQKPAIDVSFPRPTPQAINRLKMRPAEKAQFEAVFGPGSAETYLK